MSAALLPYSLRLAGQSPFDPQAGVLECLKHANGDLRDQRLTLQAKCETEDRGAFSWGAVTETLVEGSLCTAVQPVSCRTEQEAPPQTSDRGELNAGPTDAAAPSRPGSAVP